MQTNCQQCGSVATVYDSGIFLCSSCMLKPIAPSVESDDDQLPELVAAQNIAEGCKYE